MVREQDPVLFRNDFQAESFAHHPSPHMLKLSSWMVLNRKWQD